MLVEFLKMKDVLRICGLSKSELYRQMADGRFPRSRPYKDNPSRKFWVSAEILNWQRDQVGADDFDALLA